MHVRRVHRMQPAPAPVHRLGRRSARPGDVRLPRIAIVERAIAIVRPERSERDQFIVVVILVVVAATLEAEPGVAPSAAAACGPESDPFM